jgi:hypothetical protein
LSCAKPRVVIKFLLREKSGLDISNVFTQKKNNFNHELNDISI